MLKGYVCRRAWPVLAAVAVHASLAANADAQGSVAMDRAALRALYDATDGTGWTNDTNWKTSVPLDDWYGVSTDVSGRVIGLDLRENGLSGVIPVELGNLNQLQYLILHENGLSGVIPVELGNLSQRPIPVYSTSNGLSGVDTGRAGEPDQPRTAVSR